MTARRGKNKPPKPELNKQLEAIEVKPIMINTWMGFYEQKEEKGGIIWECILSLLFMECHAFFSCCFV